MNIIIAGNGKVGSTLARQLSSEGYNITLIDSNAQVLESSVERYDVIAVHGNCASMEVLQQAGVMDADLLIAVTGEDEINLLRLCDMYNVPVATNIATAEIIVTALDRGELDYRNFINPRSEYNVKRRNLKF